MLYIYNNHKKILKDGERKADRLGTWDPKSDMEVSSLGFLFVSYIPEWELKKPVTQKCK